jgi:hypothetical protein
MEFQPPIFDTGPGTYPSIFGTHNGTIKPNQDIAVQKMYTYPCAGTGGHTEYVRIWGNEIDVNASWNGYVGDWHNISFGESFTLLAGETYNYTIRTGSYPQIIHEQNHTTAGNMMIGYLRLGCFQQVRPISTLLKNAGVRHVKRKPQIPLIIR